MLQKIQDYSKSLKEEKAATTEEKTSKKDDNKFENKLATYIEENVDMIDDSVILLFIENDADKNNYIKQLIGWAVYVILKNRNLRN